MIKPKALAPNQEFSTVGQIFDAPLVVVRKTWFPLTEIAVWGIMAWEAGRLHPERNWLTRLGVGLLTMPAILGSEWCHNLAHAAAAKLVGHPTDAIRITWGMPLLVYHEIEDSNVTPRKHIIRALGGPMINTTLLIISTLLYPSTKNGSPARDVVDAALGMNAFLVLAGMLPIPALDGGAIFKWVLVEKGQTLAQADEIIRKVDAVTAAGLGACAVVTFKKRKRLLGAILAIFAAIALVMGLGLLKEKE